MTQAAPFTISRVFHAPRALVYQVHTEPSHLGCWLSPEGFASIHSNMDFREGGIYHYGLEGPHGMQMWGKQMYREILPNEKLVYIQSFSDKDGGLTRHPMSPSWPLQMLATVTFESIGEQKTRLTISWQPYEPDEAGSITFDAARTGMRQGFGGMFAKLNVYVNSLRDSAARELMISRQISAPRERVFAAWTDASQIDRWWGPNGFTTQTDSMNVTPGGEWRYTMRHPQHGEFINRIVYDDVDAPERLAYTHDNGIDGDPGAFEVMVTFVANGDKTLLTMHSLFASAEALDQVRGHGAETGAAQTLARLDVHLMQAS